MSAAACTHTPSHPQGTVLMTTTVGMNAVSLAVLFTPAASIFSWANYATAAMALAATAALYLLLPTTSPRYEYDCARAADGGNVGEGRGGDALSGLLPLLDGPSGDKAPSSDGRAPGGSIQR